VVLGFILISAIMVFPYVGAIISAYILAFLARPLFLKLRPKYGDMLAALFCIVTAIILVVVPIGLISVEILNQMGGISEGKGISNMLDAFVAQPFLKSINVDQAELKASLVQTINNMISATIQSIPNFAVGLLISLNGMFYLLCKWDMLSSHLIKYLPFKNNDARIIGFGNTAEAIIHGNVLVSLLEAAIAFVGFSLVGVQASLIFAVLIFIFAFMPSIGTELIWIPLALYYFSINQYATSLWIILIGLFLWIGIEFYFSTRFVGSRSHIHPFIMLIGILGGISVFGIFGFIIGPLILANSIKIIEGAIESNESEPRQPLIKNTKKLR
jgi:predicted PurR-regulated permease PerM